MIFEVLATCSAVQCFPKFTLVGSDMLIKDSGPRCRFCWVKARERGTAECLCGLSALGSQSGDSYWRFSCTRWGMLADCTRQARRPERRNVTDFMMEDRAKGLVLK